MHGGAPTSRHRDHVVVALSDSGGGKRIENAGITARVTEIGLASQSRKLEPMTIAGSPTYGSYFAFLERDTYDVDLEIRIPDRAMPIAVRFLHRH